MTVESRSARWEPWIALGLPALLFLGVLGQAGLWDPYELNVADLGRRAAIHVLGATGLALPGAENRIPTLGDVGRNELPVMSIAVAFRLLGLKGWVGRLPMALWGLGGLAVLWLWLRRMVSARAGTYAALLLATTPLYFVHARTMLGDVVTMAAQIAAFAGLSVALLDPDARGRAGWGLLGLLGLLAGFFSRGALLGVAVPALAVGAAWVLAALDEEPAPSSPARWSLAAVLLLGGGAAAWAALSALSQATPLQFQRAVGAAVLNGQKYPTFDAVAMALGHTLFPWSALLPVALGRLFAPPPGVAGEALRRERRLRAALIVGAALAYGAHGWLAPRTGVLPFAAVGVLAAMGGVILLDFERGAHPSRALAVASCALAALFLADFVRIPDKGMAVFATPFAAFPESFRAEGQGAVTLAALVFMLPLVLALIDPPGLPEPDPALPWYRRLTAYDDVAALLRELNELWQGNLAFVAVMVEAMLVGLGALLFLGGRLGWKLGLGNMLSARDQLRLMHAWWWLPLGLVAGLFAALTARHLFRLLLARAGLARAWVAAASGVGAGLVMSLAYYPALATQLSPRQVFETYQQQRSPSEPLGLLGVAGRSVAYYTGAEAQPFVDPAAAFRWLTGGAERRWLAVRSDDLPKLNSLYRAQAREGQKMVTPDHNLPVLDARSSQIVLVSSALAPGQANQNPFARWLLADDPHPAHPLRANLEDTLEALGWGVYDEENRKPLASVTPGQPCVLRLYWRVLAPISSQWKSFVHIDGFGKRHNGDHDVLGGKYPMPLWQPGDIVVDLYEFRLEPNFTPGNYSLYYGYFIGDRRMSVKEGLHHENRIEGGPFAVK